MEHDFKIITKSMQLGGKTLCLETGKMARQTNGSIFLTHGDTAMLITAVASPEAKEGQSFFPLTVDFVEKMYAGGKIPGGFFKREARPSTNATLSARVVDRAIRPLFPKGFLNVVHVVVTVMSYDGESDLGTLGLIGASAALHISDIPFHGPVGSLIVGMFDDEIRVCPDMLTMKDSKLELAVAGTATSICMIEAGASEISEDVVMDAIYQGHAVIKDICALQEEMAAEINLPTMPYEIDEIPAEILAEVAAKWSEKIKIAAVTEGKLERSAALKEVRNEMLVIAEEQHPDDWDDFKSYYKESFSEVETDIFRKMILNEKIRVDGRGLDDVRPISIELDILKRAHGSALFTRGETQSLGAITLGTGSDQQIIDGLAEEYKKPYYLHYNFPPYSVHEASFMRGPGRRELGHGALAERALSPVLPSKDDFPYTIRIVSEILESNGSSSMASVCSGCLGMMAAGVPIKSPVAGIANGLIMEGDDYAVLTDIQGMEDHLGDMDFKVTGTRHGITAMQMDIKIEGITKEVMGIALQKSLIARLHILDKMDAVIAAPRDEMSPYAPRIESFKIPLAKISEVIGSGGKTIKGIIEETKVAIDIDDTGTITIASPDGVAIQKAIEIINNIIMEPERDEVYPGEVTRIEPYGAFVRFMGNKMGLVHVSQMHAKRVNKPEDLVKLNQTLNVKFCGMKEGKYQLTMKGVEGNPELPEDYVIEARSDGDRGGRSRDRNDRGRDSRGGYSRDRNDRGRDNRGGYDRDRNRDRGNDRNKQENND